MSPPLVRGEWGLEVEVLPGLEDFAISEIEKKSGQLLGPRRTPKEGRLLLTHATDLHQVNRLRSIVAAHLVLSFDVPRPKALLGHQNLQRIIACSRLVLAAFPKGEFASVRLSAAGSDSAVFTRLKRAIAAELNLAGTAREGDLLVTCRRAVLGNRGWEVLVRTSPRPLTARAWRVCDMPGALNASVAHVMVNLAEPNVSDRFVNLCSGSGTLMVERMEVGPADFVMGLDIDQRAMECSRKNLQASGHRQSASLVLGDARALPLSSNSVQAVVADLPYAQLMGSTPEIEDLYPALVREAARVVVSGGRCVLITTRRRLMIDVLDDVREQWDQPTVFPLKIAHQRGYISPAIYVLRRSRAPHA